MEIPSLVRQSLGGEEIEAGVTLGDEDLICLTPTRTLLYRAEGLLSDEKVEEYPHEIERLDVKEGRRKTKFVVEYVDGSRSFSVPSNRDTQALELFMTGVLRGADVADPDESVVGAFRFSELALVVTDARVVKHIGSSVWSADYEVYAFEALTGLRFERASVATEVVLEIGGRPQRIKTPNERARKVQQVIENAVFEYYGVESLDALTTASPTTRAPPRATPGAPATISGSAAASTRSSPTTRTRRATPGPPKRRPNPPARGARHGPHVAVTLPSPAPVGRGARPRRRTRGTQCPSRSTARRSRRCASNSTSSPRPSTHRANRSNTSSS